MLDGFTIPGGEETPLVSEILPGLWMGGCVGGVRLPATVGFVLSLYPWEQFDLQPGTEAREERLYDKPRVPNEQLLHELAGVVNRWRDRGVVLVHCRQGFNRAGLVVALSLMQRGVPAGEAVGLLRAQRSPRVLSNAVFERWLGSNRVARQLRRRRVVVG